MLNYLKNRYHNIPMYITENGTNTSTLFGLYDLYPFYKNGMLKN